VRISLLLMLALVSGQSRLFAGVEATPFKLAAQGGILVPVTLNGTGPFQMLLDTGASHSSISKELAGALDAPPVARATVSTPAGDRE